MTTGDYKKKMHRAYYLMTHRHQVKLSTKTVEKLRTTFATMQSDMMKERIKLGKFNSPFANPITHRKTMATRSERGTNVFVTNNPMHIVDSLQKKVAKTSGANHYLRQRRQYFISTNNIDWEKLDTSNGLTNAVKLRGWSLASFHKSLNTHRPMTSGALEGIYIMRTIV